MVWIETYAPVLIGMGIGVGMFEVMLKNKLDYLFISSEMII